MAMSAHRQQHAITILQSLTICSKLLQPRIKRNLYSQLDRGARCREPRNSGREYIEAIAGL